MGFRSSLLSVFQTPPLLPSLDQLFHPIVDICAGQHGERVIRFPLGVKWQALQSAIAREALW